MGAITKTASALLSLAVLTSAKPVLRRQDATPTEPAAAAETSDINTTINITYYCNNQRTDTLNPDQMQIMWEDGTPSIGAWLSEWAEYVGENPNDQWADNIFTVVDPNIGNNGLGGCGVIGSQCNPNIDCEDWASRGYGGHYWAIQALVGFHDKLNVAHEYLQDSTLENFMSLTEIANDFTAPSTWTTADDMYAILGAIFYMVGGAAGFAGLGAGYAGSAIARAGVAKAAKARVQPSIDKLADGTIKDSLQKRLDDSIRTAEEMLGKQGADGATRSTATLGASTYLVGGIFGVVGIGSEDAFGEVEAGDLEPMLKEIFTNARGYLEQLGRLAAGRADPSKGDDYNFLPGQNGINGAYPVESNPIAQFFHDGNMLLGPAHPTFNQTLEDAFSTMRPRIVDQALVTGKFYVFADELMESEEDCKDFAETGDGDDYPWYGSQWVDGYCMRLMRESDSEQLCSNGQDRCSHFPASRTDYDNLQEKYGFDMFEYYKSALDCKLNGGEDRKPDLWGLPDDGSVPRCWYGIEARKGLEDCGIYDGSPQSCDIRFSDF